MSDGTLLELVSRGKKDAYQIQDPVRSWFGSPYETRSPATREIRVLYPENQPRFGQWFDVVLPPDGDILVSFDLRITLPTWLPPRIAALNATGSHDIKVLSQPYEIQAYPFVGTPTVPVTFPILQNPTPTEYGWCDGVANFMIGRWALFVDNLIVLEGYGDFNTWFPDMETTQMQAPLIHASTGRNNGNIQSNATLPELVFRVPLPGCQGKGDTGLPICAFKHQKVYMRFWLLDKTELVESGELRQLLISLGNLGPYAPKSLPLYELCPTPWGGRQIRVDSTVVPEVTLTSTQMGQPSINARCVVLNVDNELRKSLAAQKFEIRFRQQLRDYWSIADAAFVPGVNFRQTLQINGFFQSLFVGFRSLARTKQNKYTDILATNNADWLTNLSLNVNGLNRIQPWAPKKFKTLANNTQLARDVNIALYYLIFGVSPENEPGGAFNLSRCQKAVLNLILNDVQVDPMTGVNDTHAFILGLSWNVFDIENGVAKLRFPH